MKLTRHQRRNKCILGVFAVAATGADTGVGTLCPYRIARKAGERSMTTVSSSRCSFEVWESGMARCVAPATNAAVVPNNVCNCLTESQRGACSTLMGSTWIVHLQAEVLRALGEACDLQVHPESCRLRRRGVDPPEHAGTAKPRGPHAQRARSGAPLHHDVRAGPRGTRDELKTRAADQGFPHRLARLP